MLAILSNYIFVYFIRVRKSRFRYYLGELFPLHILEKQKEKANIALKMTQHFFRDKKHCVK
jgi:hypothetical protein